MKDAQTFWCPGGLFCPVFPVRDRNEPGGFNLIRTRIERYGIAGAKKNCGTGSLTAFFVSVVLALLGAALKDVLFGSFYALPFAKMAFLALLCALVILTLFWMLLGILDAFGRRETAGRWILAFGVLLFFAAP